MMNEIEAKFQKIISKQFNDRLAYIQEIKKNYELLREQGVGDFLKFPKLCLKEIQGKKNGTLFPETVFHLLNAYEIKFCESGLKEKYPKVYYQIYYSFYLMYMKWPDNENIREIKNWIQKKWLTVCFNSQSDKNLKFWLESRNIDPNDPIDVEGNVKCILFDGVRLKKNFELNGSEMGFYASRAIDWFLKRYDWVSAFSIIRKSIWNNARLLQCILIMCNIFFILLFTRDSIVSLFSNNLIPPPIASATNDIHISNAINGIPLHIECTLAVLFIIVVILVAIMGKFVRFFLPRLLGAVFIGFLPLLTSPEMYAFPLKMNWFQISIISGFFLFIAFLYLKIECYSMVGKKEVFNRALSILLYGLLISFVMSLFLCDIAAVHFIDYTKGSYPVGYKGLFGIIYPKIVLFFAPAALLIGIFIQIFWEEKTITEPL